MVNHSEPWLTLRFFPRDITPIGIQYVHWPESSNDRHFTNDAIRSQGTLRPPPDVAAVSVTSQVGDVVHDVPPKNHDDQVACGGLWWLTVEMVICEMIWVSDD